MSRSRWTAAGPGAGCRSALSLGVRADDALRSRQGAAPRRRPLTRAARRRACEPCPTRSRAGASSRSISLPCLGRRTATSLLFDGRAHQQPTLVNVYGSWCGPCREEMPLLRQLHASGRHPARAGRRGHRGRPPRRACCSRSTSGSAGRRCATTTGSSPDSSAAAPRRPCSSTPPARWCTSQRGTYQSLAALQADVRTLPRA